MRILILGGSGMIGHKLWELLPRRFSDTWMGLRRPASAYAAFPLLQGKRVVCGVDVTDPQALESTLNEIKPDVILNAAGLTKRHEGAKSDASAIARIIRLNAEYPHQLAAWAKTRGTRVILFSTDCVFNGKAGGYSESDPPNAEDLYGRTKALGEITAEEGRCLTIRTSMIGRELFSKTELLEWFLSQKNGKIRGFRQAIFSGVATWVMADLVADLIEKHPDLSGLYQVAAEPIDKYKFLCLAREAFNTDVEIEPDDSFVCKRNLDGSRFRAETGWVAPSWAEMLKGVANERK